MTYKNPFPDPKKKKAAVKKKSVKAKTTDFFCAFIRSTIKEEIIPEYKFLENRKFKFDYAILKYRIAIEQEGGVFMKGGGAHSRPLNILRDMEKYSLAGVEGWVIIRRTPQQMNTNQTLELIKQAIAMRKQNNFESK